MSTPVEMKLPQIRPIPTESHETFLITDPKTVRMIDSLSLPVQGYIVSKRTLGIVHNYSSTNIIPRRASAQYHVKPQVYSHREPGVSQGHSSLKSYACSVCPKIFRSRSEFQRHTRVHTGERPYGCKLCSAKFKQKSHLKVHMLGVHTAYDTKSGNTSRKMKADSAPEAKKVVKNPAEKRPAMAKAVTGIPRSKKRLRCYYIEENESNRRFSSPVYTATAYSKIVPMEATTLYPPLPRYSGSRQRTSMSLSSSSLSSRSSASSLQTIRSRW